MQYFKGNVSVDRDGLHGFMAEVSCIQGDMVLDLEAITQTLDEMAEGARDRCWILRTLVEAALRKTERLAEENFNFGRKVLDLEKAQGCPPVV